MGWGGGGGGGEEEAGGMMVMVAEESLNFSAALSRTRTRPSRPWMYWRAYFFSSGH